jgi:Zn-finger nucleic acid-binding protein
MSMANCSSCSAPLPSGGITCEYCGSRNDIDLVGVHYHTTHEIESPRSCPRCNLALKTIDLGLGGGTFLIERCGSCFGLFFDPGELEALLEASVSNVFEIKQSQIDSINEVRRSSDYGVSYIKCPECSQLMNRMNFGTRSGVIVDRCREHGVWLDGGELRHLMEWMKAGGKLLDQQRREERQKEDAAQREKRGHLAEEYSFPATGCGRSDGSLYGRNVPASQGHDLLDTVCEAIGFLLR